MDDAWATIGQARYGGYRDPNFLGFGYDYGACVTDVRQRVTFSGTYALPFGHGKRFLNNTGLLDKVAGGWKGSLLFVAQTGLPVFLNSSNQGESYPFRVADPFTSGGTPATDGTQNSFVCATQTRTVQSWYNPCAFKNPPIAVADSTPGCPGVPGTLAPNEVCLSKAGLLPFGPKGRASVEGPGYNKVDMSFFKNFKIPFRESQLQFRADIFSLLNHPSFAIPSNGLSGSTASTIMNTLFSGETPDARLIQFALKYSF
jgi:hypothetical protein